MIRFSRRRGGRARELMFATPQTAPPPRRRRRATLGDHHDDEEPEPIPDPVTIQLRQLQNALIRAGYDIGPTGADGRWGPATHGAFERFLAREDPGGTGQIRVDATVSPQMVLMEQSVWNAIVNATPGSGGERQSRRRPSGGGSGSTTTTTTPDPGSDSSGAADVDLGEEDSKWWQSPWLWGAVALAAGAGVVFVATREPEDEELLPAF